MIVYKERNQQGWEDARLRFEAFVTCHLEATPIDRVSYLFGIQSFCRHQLRQELAAAIDALDLGDCDVPGEPDGAGDDGNRLVAAC